MKILLADDHAMMRHGLRAILEKEMDVQSVEEAANGREAVEIARRTRPSVVVMDIGMPGLNGIDATREIVSDNRDTKVIALSMNSDRRYVLAMFAAGAAGYLLKDAASSELILAIRAVLQNQTYVSPAVAEDVVATVRRAQTEPSPKALSVREREVLQLLAEGKTSKDIAAALGVALPTVETHRRQIMAKLGLRSIAELTKYAIREGLTALEK
ncbi:MAG TPA: response regulator transcription factor [Polyangiaceae bacterium]|jgi:DNA-binding NarL/FixJ family response regulator